MVHAADHPQRDDLSDAGRAAAAHAQDAPAVASQAGVSSPWYLLLYAVAITLALGLMRFAWVWLSMKLTIFRRKRRGKAITVRPRFSILAVMALAGVKGSVTLAGILTRRWCWQMVRRSRAVNY